MMVPGKDANPLTAVDARAHFRRVIGAPGGSWNDALNAVAAMLRKEAEECINDIVAGDEIGAREAKARSGALFTAADDVDAMRR